MKTKVSSNDIDSNISVTLYREDIKDSPDVGKKSFNVSVDKDSDIITLTQLASPVISQIDTWVIKLPIDLVKMVGSLRLDLPVVNDDFYYDLGFAHGSNDDLRVLKVLNKSAYMLDFATSADYQIYAIRTPSGVVLYFYTRQYLLTTVRLEDDVLIEMLRVIK